MYSVQVGTNLPEAFSEEEVGRVEGYLSQTITRRYSIVLHFFFLSWTCHCIIMPSADSSIFTIIDTPAQIRRDFYWNKRVVVESLVDFK